QDGRFQRVLVVAAGAVDTMTTAGATAACLCPFTLVKLVTTVAAFHRLPLRQNAGQKQELVQDPAAAESKNADEQADCRGHLQPALLLHDEELGDTGYEEGQGHGGNSQLARVHQSLFLHVVEPGGTVITAEEAEDEGNCSLAGKAD